MTSMPPLIRWSLIAIAGIGLIAAGYLVGHQTEKKAFDGSIDGGDFTFGDESPSDAIVCTGPNRAEVEKTFVETVNFVPPQAAKGSPGSARQATSKGATGSSGDNSVDQQAPKASGTVPLAMVPPIEIEMPNDKSITYNPAHFILAPSHEQSVYVTLHPGAGASGLVSIRAYPKDNHNWCEQIVDTGFQGHLQIPDQKSLSFDEPRALDVQLLDGNNKPLGTGMNLTMEIQSADGLLAQVKQDLDARWSSVLYIDMSPGASSTGQFRFKPTNAEGGPLHISAALRLVPNGVGLGNVLTQSTFTFEADAVMWLPIIMAIGGAWLHALYRISQELPDVGHVGGSGTGARKVGLFIASTLLASALAGAVAWLFADFDLLGLKLDPHVLKTYPLLGFLFSFVGVDVILKKRFTAQTVQPQNGTPTGGPAQQGAQPKSAEARLGRDVV